MLQSEVLQPSKNALHFSLSDQCVELSNIICLYPCLAIITLIFKLNEVLSGRLFLIQ